MEMVDARTNPAAANAVVAAALNEAPQDPGLPPTPPGPPVRQVVLPGGWVSPLTADYVTTATVRELNGDDEEAIASAMSPAKTLDAIIGRGVLTIGEETPTKAVLDTLLAGDRDALLVAIRQATFGDEIDFGQVACPECGKEQPLVISCESDIPTRRYASPVDKQWTVGLPSGTVATVEALSVSAQRKILESTSSNAGVLVTELLVGCVKMLGDMPVLGEGQVRALSMRDRNLLVKEIGEHTPGPLLREVKKSCQGCEADIAVPLSVVELFRG